MGVFTEHLTYRDCKGNTARMTFYTSQTTEGAATTAFGNIVTGIAGITNAALQSALGAYEISPQAVLYGTTDEFKTVEDKAVFTFQTAAGDIHRFQVPCPKSSIFLADGETVDATNTNVVAFTSAVVAGASNRSGTGIVFGGFGIRRRTKPRRKLNIFVKSPGLDEPAE